MDTLLIFFLNRSFLDINLNPFLILRVAPVSVYNFKLRAKFRIYRFHSCESDFLHFLGYKYKIRLVSILGKREDKALISISTILKFSAQVEINKIGRSLLATLIFWQIIYVGFLYFLGEKRQ